MLEPVEQISRSLGGTMSDTISLSEAAKLVGKTPGALRRLVNEGRIRSTKDSSGRHNVRRDDVIAHYAINRRSGASSSLDENNLSDPLVSSLRDQISILKANIEQDRIEKTELRLQNRELQGQIVKLASEMQALLARETDGKLSRWFRK